MNAPSTALTATLRQVRHARRLSQLELSLRLQVSQRHVSFVESGRARPSRELLAHPEGFAAPIVNLHEVGPPMLAFLRHEASLQPELTHAHAGRRVDRIGEGGTVTEREGSRVKIELDAEQWRCHRPHPGKEAKRYQVEEARELLERVGVAP